MISSGADKAILIALKLNPSCGAEMPTALYSAIAFSACFVYMLASVTVTSLPLHFFLKRLCLRVTIPGVSVELLNR